MVLKAVLMRSGLVSLTTTRQVNTAQPKTTVNSARPMTNGNQQQDFEEKGVIDNRCSRHMTGNMSYLTDFEKIDEGYVAFGGNPKGGKIIGRVPRKNNMYSVDLKNIVPKGGLTCLFAKATSDESKLWHRRLGHINFKTMNKLVKGNLVRGLPSKLFENNQTCVACQKGKQHRASLLVTKPHNKTTYELFLGRKLALGFMRQFECPVTIINAIDHLGNQSNGNIGTKACDDAGKMQTVPGKDYIMLPLWPVDPLFSQSSMSSPDAEFKPSRDNEKKVTKEPGKEGGDSSKDSECSVNSTNNVNAASTNKVNDVGRKSSIELPDDPNMLELEDIVYSDDEVGVEADMNNLDAFIPVSPIPTTRIHKDHPPSLDRVYKVEKELYGLHQAPRAWYETLSPYLLDNGFQRGKIDKTLFIRREKVKQKKDGIFISQDKYVTEILKKFGFTDVKTASTPMETQKPLLKDKDVCACARHQVNPKVSHLHVMKRIFRYLKVWIGNLQHEVVIVVANSTTEVEYVAALSCCGQVLWIQN
ncbi:putative ribonuclease H-like domain-containing protein [Tanacetum coccineum]